MPHTHNVISIQALCTSLGPEQARMFPVGGAVARQCPSGLPCLFPEPLKIPVTRAANQCWPCSRHTSHPKAQLGLLQVSVHPVRTTPNKETSSFPVSSVSRDYPRGCGYLGTIILCDCLLTGHLAFSTNKNVEIKPTSRSLLSRP